MKKIQDACRNNLLTGEKEKKPKVAPFCPFVPPLDYEITLCGLYFAVFWRVFFFWFWVLLLPLDRVLLEVSTVYFWGTFIFTEGEGCLYLYPLLITSPSSGSFFYPLTVPLLPLVAPPFSSICQVKIPKKAKFFAWQALHGKANTLYNELKHFLVLSL